MARNDGGVNKMVTVPSRVFPLKRRPPLRVSSIDKSADGYEARLARLRAELAMLDRRRPTLLSWIQLYEGFVDGAPQPPAADQPTLPPR